MDKYKTLELMEKLFRFFLDSLFKKKQDVIFRTDNVTENTSWDLTQGVNDIAEVTFYNGGNTQMVIEGINTGGRGGSVTYTVTAFERLNQTFDIKFFPTSPGQINLCVITYKQFQTKASLWE